MRTTLDRNDINFLLESLNYTRLNFENTEYPSRELRRERLKEVEDLVNKLKNIRDETLGEEPN